MQIILEDGNQVLADLVVGADGVRSKLRLGVAGGAPPSFSGVMVIMGMASVVSFSQPCPFIQSLNYRLGTIAYAVAAC